MKQNILMFVGLFVLALTVTGCRAGGQGFGQPAIGGQFQQPVLGGGFQQPSAQRTQQAIGNFGRNLGSRFSNGILNRGVNYAINQAISGF